MSTETPISEQAERYLRDQRLHEWVRSCLGKIKFVSQEHANAACGRARRRRKVVLRTYYCRHCGGWHLTKRMD